MVGRKMKQYEELPDDLEERIRVDDIMEGNGLKKDLKKVAKGYRKHVRPVVTTAAKATLPVMKTAIKVAMPAALASIGVPPAAIAPLAALGSELATEGLRATLNKSGVTEGAGIKHIMPVNNAKALSNIGLRPPVPKRKILKSGRYQSMSLMGAGVDPLNAYDDTAIATQMKSKPQAAINQMNLQQVRVRGDDAAQHVNALPAQMQSKPTMTGMNLTPAVAVRGDGLYPAGMHRGNGLYH